MSFMYAIEWYSFYDLIPRYVKKEKFLRNQNLG